jgi:O-antigen ligase
MSYCLFLGVTLMLFLRPGDLVSSSNEVPIYEWLIIGCTLTSVSGLAKQLRWASIREQPVKALVLGIGAAATMSALPHSLSEALVAAIACAKNLLFYLLLLVQIDSPRRLLNFLLFLMLCILALGALPILHQQGIIHLESLDAVQQGETDLATGDRYYIPRMQSTGIFNDPNDLAIVTAVGILLCGWFALGASSIGARLLGVAGMLPLYYVLYETRSRGGMLALMGGLAVFGITRFGWRKALPLLSAVLPVLLLASAGRVAEMSVTEGTGQQRIRLWSEGIEMLRSSPLFGVGYMKYAEHAGLQAHNSFVNSYAELGFCGGTCFFGAFACAATMLHRAVRPAAKVPTDDITWRARPVLLAITASYVTGMMSLSRAYVLPTYLVLGIDTAWLSLAGVERSYPSFRLGTALVQRLSLASGLFVVLIYIYIRLFAVWA